MADMAGEVVLDSVAVGQRGNLGTGHVHGRNNHNHVAAHGGHVQGNLYLNPGSVSIPKESSPRGYLLLTDQEALWKDLAGQVYHRLSL